MSTALTVAHQPMPFAEMERLGEYIAKSGLFGIKTKEAAIVLMSIAQAEGRHPVEAARDYDVVNNRPAKKAEAMMRDFIKAGGTIKWHSLTDELADATFTHPQTGSVRIDWDMTRAQTAFGKKDMYTKFPRQMLRSRVVSEGVRTLWPLATSGMYEPGEAAEIPSEHNGPTIEHTADDERSAINDAVPLKAAAQRKMLDNFDRGEQQRTRERQEDEAPPRSTASQERTDAQWRVWLDKMRAAGDVLYRREEFVEMANRASIGDAIANGPPWVRAEISAYLAEGYARFPEPEAEELPEVAIAGEEKLAAGD